VDAILDAVHIGNITLEESETVRNLLREFADVFALSVKEVKPLPSIKYRLNIPEDATFSVKANQRPLNQAQKVFYFPKLEEFVNAGVLRPIHASQVKAVHPTVLAQKAHETPGLTMDEIRQEVNEQCILLGEPPDPNTPRRTTPSPQTEQTNQTEPKKPKWRITQNFSQLSRICQSAQVPQGDLRAKQQRLAGYKYICVIDFASGFYAVKVDEDSQPYLCIYTEGVGYHAYARMPMGIADAPSWFCDMTGRALHDLTTKIHLETFVDDNALAGDEFADVLHRLRVFLERCREHNLSVSPQKTRLFVQETVFGGSRVGKDGIKPDVAKLEAVAKWPAPLNLLDLMRFLGLTGYFRSLIRDYARIAAPLTDLQRNLDLSQPEQRKGNRRYRQFLRDRDLTQYWTAKHTKAFTRLKNILLEEPTLRAPKFDGTPFILITDGSKDGFGAVLAQRFTTNLPDGETKTVTHPIGYASKRTAPVEERYKPYVLEFAALKFGLDHFSNTIWGFPVEIETDCRAMKDTLCNDTLNLHHARWKDGIQGYYVTAVRHRSGTSNTAADALSRMYTGRERTTDDGSTWLICEDWEASRGIVNDLFGIYPDEVVSSLCERFTDEPIFLEVVQAITKMDSHRNERERNRARHRAEGYQIEEGKLWRIADGKSIRAKPRLECISQTEAIELAKHEHHNNGHWGRDLTKLQLMDRIHSPRLDQSVTIAILQCPQCKNFGSSHLHALMYPITRCHPFELLVADYLSLPKGKGGYHTVLLILNTYSRFMWGFKFKTSGTAKTTLDGLRTVTNAFRPPETLMTDGGSHFNNGDVRSWCEAQGTTHQVVAAYAPWINGLVENANGKLLGRLKHLCSPGLGEDNYEHVKPESIAKAWPDHFDAAIRQLNERIVPSLQFSPKELLLGFVVNTAHTPPATSSMEPTHQDITAQMAYVDQQRLDGANRAALHAIKRKAAFDRKVLRTNAGEVIFESDQLVQVYDNSLDTTLSTTRKLLPQWSAPRRIAQRAGNSYTLKTLEGFSVPGWAHARRLHEFVPRKGTNLDIDEEGREEGRRRDEETTRKVTIGDEEEDEEDGDSEEEDRGDGEDGEG
jgi:transposase InsO family protein